MPYMRVVVAQQGLGRIRSDSRSKRIDHSEKTWNNAPGQVCSEGALELRLMILPEEMRADLKNPLGRLCKGNGLECIKVMSSELKLAKKVAAVGDMTAFYLLESGMQPDLIIVDHKTKRTQIPEHIKQSLIRDKYKTVEVVNPPATLTRGLLDAISNSLSCDEKTKIVVDGEEDLATLPVILCAPLGSVVVYGQPNEGSVIVNVTPEKKEQIKNLMNKMIVEE